MIVLKFLVFVDHPFARRDCQEFNWPSFESMNDGRTFEIYFWLFVTFLFDLFEEEIVIGV